jgi:hypothetical protein
MRRDWLYSSSVQEHTGNGSGLSRNTFWPQTPPCIAEKSNYRGTLFPLCSICWKTILFASKSNFIPIQRKLDRASQRTLSNSDCKRRRTDPSRSATCWAPTNTWRAQTSVIKFSIRNFVNLVDITENGRLPTACSFLKALQKILELPEYMLDEVSSQYAYYFHLEGWTLDMNMSVVWLQVSIIEVPSEATI